MLYCNDGDWVESLSALVETHEGELKIVRWSGRLAPGTPVLRWDEPEPTDMPHEVAVTDALLAAASA